MIEVKVKLVTSDVVLKMLGVSDIDEDEHINKYITLLVKSILKTDEKVIKRRKEDTGDNFIKLVDSEKIEKAHADFVSYIQDVIIKENPKLKKVKYSPSTHSTYGVSIYNDSTWCLGVSFQTTDERHNVSTPFGYMITYDVSEASIRKDLCGILLDGIFSIMCFMRGLKGRDLNIRGPVIFVTEDGRRFDSGYHRDGADGSVVGFDSKNMCFRMGVYNTTEIDADGNIISIGASNTVETAEGLELHYIVYDSKTITKF